MSTAGCAGLGLQDVRLYPNSMQAAAAAAGDGDGTNGASQQQPASGCQQLDEEDSYNSNAAAADLQHGKWLAAADADDSEDSSQADPTEAAEGSLQPFAALQAAAATAGGGSTDLEVLSLRADRVLAAGRGIGGEPDVLLVHVTAAGPFSKRGTYRWGWLRHIQLALSVTGSEWRRGNVCEAALTCERLWAVTSSAATC